MQDRHGLGRIPSLWWTLNPKYNALYEIHRLNVRAQLGRDAVANYEDNLSDVRFDYVRSAPDLASYMIALRTELSMRVVMPAVLPHSADEPYLCMARFETGASGNPHLHGFSLGAGGPRLGRVRADRAEDQHSGDEGERSADEDGQHLEAAAAEDTSAVEDDGDVAAASAPDGVRESAIGEPESGSCAAMAGPDVPPPPAPVGPPRQKRSRLSRQLRAQASEVDATRGKYDHNSDVQLQAQTKHVFAEYFGGLVSEWNPCYDADGNVRYFWDEEVGAHDVEVTGGVNAACPERARLRTVLDRVFREEELDAKTGQAKPVDLTPVRRLVAALVESSGRHKLHLRCAPKLGVHAFARGKPECPMCRYGFPLPRVARGGARPMRLDKGEKLGSWFARFPRNDQICNNHEPHLLLANLGNIDWRPCLNLWAVCEYVTKYATKAPEGSKRLADVLSAAVDEVCKYEAEGEGADMLRKAVQKTFAKTLGDRDFGIFEAVHLGLRLPLVFSLMEVVSLNTMGVRVLRSRQQVRDASDHAPVTWDSKVDKFDQRKELVERKAGLGRSDLCLDDVRDTSLYEFWWKFKQAHGRLMKVSDVRVLMVTPGFSADSACAFSVRHADYARSAVIAY